MQNRGKQAEAHARLAQPGQPERHGERGATIEIEADFSGKISIATADTSSEWRKSSTAYIAVVQWSCSMPGLICRTKIEGNRFARERL